MKIEDLVGCRLIEVIWLMEGVPALIFDCDGKIYRYDPPIPCEYYSDYITEIG
jgi:hypothetical protein